MNTIFTKNLQNLIESSGKTQNQISKELNIARQQLSNWKTGYIEPNLDNLITIAQYFNVSIDYLLGRETDFNVEHQYNPPTELPNKAVAFANEYSELIDDGNFQNIAKLCRDITPELRALALGYLVGLLKNNGVNTKKILGY